MIEIAHDAPLRARAFACLWPVAVAAALALAAGAARAQPPVPFYSANVKQIDKQGPGSIVIVTRDGLDTVAAWYRAHLAERTGERKVDGAIIFYTKSGATVDVEPGLSFDPGTHIGLVWDAKKFGPYTGQ